MRQHILRALVLGVVLVAACGDDDGGSDESDAAAVSDAAPLADAGPEDDGGSDSPYQLVTCSGDTADAGADQDAGSGDAGPSDAGTPGVGAPCCDPDGPCSAGLACIEGPDGERSCREDCDLADGECPSGGVCASFEGDGVCIPAGTEGQDCAPELCDAETICVGETADDATCHRRCESQDDCDEGTTCSTLVGSNSMACL